MNTTQWNKCDNKAKARYLLNCEIHVKCKQGIRADSKLGDHENSCVTVYAAFAGKVQISDWRDTNLLAMQQAVTVLTNWKKELL